MAVRIWWTRNFSEIKGKTITATRWLKRQHADPYVKQAKLDDYRSRSAYKLLEIDKKYNFLKPNSIVLDCGARPGSWSQVAALKTKSYKLSQEALLNLSKGGVIAVDIEDVEPLAGVIALGYHDLRDPQTLERIKQLLKGNKLDVVMSDMAPNASGIHSLDHERILELCNCAFEVCVKLLKEEGSFLCKLWEGPCINDFKTKLKASFRSVAVHRPKATRKESSEVYFYANSFKTTN